MAWVQPRGSLEYELLLAEVQPEGVSDLEGRHVVHLA
jgi:hypothetical protein